MSNISLVSPPGRKACASPLCKYTLNQWRHRCACYSPVCLAATRRSNWHHPKIKRLLARARIITALRVKQEIGPYSSFVPRSLHDYLIHLSSTNWEEVPFGAVREGAVLFSDASGFTALTERLAKRPAGAELLCEILNKFFTILVEKVHKWGGDIVKFAGDAVSVVWFVGKIPGVNPKDLTEATRWATQCAADIHDSLSPYHASIPNEEQTIELSLHMGVGCGSITCIHVGGVFGRWEYVMAGDPQTQISVAEPLALPGETVVSPEAWEQLRDVASGTLLRDLVHTQRKKTPKIDEYTFVRLDSLQRDKCTSPQGREPNKLSRAQVNLLCRYIPAAVLPKLTSGHSAYIAELRDVSVLFVNVLEVDIAQAVDGDCTWAVEQGQQLMLAVQHTIYFWEGSINKFLVDDKGLLILCVFGLPPLAHGDDAKRAVGAAKMLIESIRSIGPEVSCKVGVTSGRAFCGVVGSTDRREYTVMGDMVNLAARLMGAAGPNEVLVDETTMLASKSYMQYEARDALTLKGKEHPVSNYSPTSPTKGGSTHRESDERTRVFRQKNFEELKEMLTRDCGGATIVLTGERGSGKSALVNAVMELGGELGLNVLKGRNKAPTHAGAKFATWAHSVKRMASVTRSLSTDSTSSDVDSPERRVSALVTNLLTEGPKFAAWSGVFRDLIDQGCSTTGMSHVEYIKAAVPPEDHAHIALINIVVPGLDVPYPPSARDSTAKASVADLGATLHSKRTSSMSSQASSASSYGSDPASRHFWDLSISQRVQRLKKILPHLIEYSLKANEVLIVLHLKTGTSMQLPVDAESWGLAHLISRICKDRKKDENRLLLMIVSRPLITYAPVEFIEIAEEARRNKWLHQLQPLGEQERYRYLQDVLRTSDFPPLPPQLVTYVSDMAAGNPKHIEELVAQLRKDGAIKVEDGIASVLVEDLNESSVPGKMRGILRQQIDRMQPRHQLILKVASTFPNSFSLKMLMQIFPFARDRHFLPPALTSLVESGILIEHKGRMPADVLRYHPEARQCYSFQSKLIQQEAKAQLLQANRKELDFQKYQMAVRNTVRSIIRIKTKTLNWLEALRMASLHRPPRQTNSASSFEQVLSPTSPSKVWPRREDVAARASADTSSAAPAKFVPKSHSFKRTSVVRGKPRKSAPDVASDVEILIHPPLPAGAAEGP